MIGDTQPFEYQLKWDDGTAIDLRTATGVKFMMYEDGATTATVDAACVITDAENGKVTYNFATGDVDTGGMYKYRYKITFSTTKILSVPSNDVLWLYIIDPLWM
jgi:hypothetical protein